MLLKKKKGEREEEKEPSPPLAPSPAAPDLPSPPPAPLSSNLRSFVDLKRQSQGLAKRSRTLLAIWVNAGREADSWVSSVALSASRVSLRNSLLFLSIRGYCEWVGVEAVRPLSLSELQELWGTNCQCYSGQALLKALVTQ